MKRFVLLLTILSLSTLVAFSQRGGHHGSHDGRGKDSVPDSVKFGHHGHDSIIIIRHHGPHDSIPDTSKFRHHRHDSISFGRHHHHDSIPDTSKFRHHRHDSIMGGKHHPFDSITDGKHHRTFHRPPPPPFDSIPDSMRWGHHPGDSLGFDRHHLHCDSLRDSLRWKHRNLDSIFHSRHNHNDSIKPSVIAGFVYPNPVKDYANIELNALVDGISVNVDVLDQNQQVLASYSYSLIKGKQTIKVDAAALTKGIYIIRITGTNIKILRMFYKI